MERKIQRILNRRTTVEGAGVKLKRVLGNDDNSTLDPFLLLDHFGSDKPEDYILGFPWHPHRGMETVTYMWTGEVVHGDSIGNKGVIKSGDVQWMTAGSGIIHQEMPQKYDGLMQGFQLWVNLPAAKKMVTPKYRGIDDKQIPIIRKDGAKIKLIAGKVDRTIGPVQDLAIDIEYFDVELSVGKSFVHLVPKNNTVFSYVVEGLIEIAGKQVMEGQCTVLGEGNNVTITAAKRSRLLFVSGAPLGEPVAWRGPIVMNTEEELDEAFRELRLGTFIKTKNVLDPKQRIDVL
ncbi:MAG TPA: pirin family protein [Candidatus Sulfotelmatobacter sp.]|nr:pirin family protein [Candidatus Sulfotelmatobacter sp.]